MNKTIITFGGDVLVKSLKDISVSKEVTEIFKNSDLVIANLEGAETSNNKKIDKAGPNLKQDSGTIRWLRKLGFDCLGLANNHIMDFGEKGLFDTLEKCNKVGIRWCGGGSNLREAIQPVRIGSKISVFSAAEKEFGYIRDGDDRRAGYLTFEPRHSLEKAILEEKNAGRFVILLVHGGCEESPFPTRFSRNKYRELITKGADIVVGSHPHVSQGYERFQGKEIYYSLGDFTVGFSSNEENKWGLLLQIEITGEEGKKYHSSLIPIVKIDGQIRLMNKQKADKCLKLLKDISNICRDSQSFEQYYKLQNANLFKSRYAHFLNQLFFKSPPLLWYLRFQNKPYQGSTDLKLAETHKLLMKLMFTNETHLENINEWLDPNNQKIEIEDKYESSFQYFLNGVNDFSKV